MKKVSFFIQQLIIYLLTLTIFIIVNVFSKNLDDGYLISIFVMAILLAFLFYLNSKIFCEPIIEFTNLLNHFNNNEFAYKTNTKTNKEIYTLGTEINKLGNILDNTTSLLNEKTAENKNYYNQYLNDLETKKQLVASISHEIKTPLAVIEAIANAIIDEVITGDDIKTELNNIIEETKKTNAMLKEIISIYKLDTDNISLKFEAVNLGDIIIETANELESLITKYKHTLILSGSFNLSIKANYEQLKRTLRNIVLNGITYSPSNSEIQIILEERPEYYVLKIINTNTSIAKQDLPKLFEPFYRGDKSRTKKEDIGNGLGLYIVKETLNKHNLDHGIRNTQDGVEFYIIIKPENLAHK